MSDSGYGKANKTMYWRMYAGHNCTNYAAYRMVHSGLANSRPWTGSGNATNWGKAMSRITNATPAVGAVAWWRAGVKPAGSAGHVAYVERVVSANEIIVSMDSWHGDFSWARVTRTTAAGRAASSTSTTYACAARPPPKVTGTAKVGSTLTVSPGTWTPVTDDPRLPVAGRRRRHRGRHRDDVHPDDRPGRQGAHRAGERLRAGLPDSDRALRRDRRRAARSADATSLPRIDGPPRSARPWRRRPTWTPAPDRVDYQWLADDVVLPGATSATLHVGPALAGKALSRHGDRLEVGLPGGHGDLGGDGPGGPGPSRSPRPRGSTAWHAGTGPRGRPAEHPARVRAVQWLRNGVPVAGATGRSYRLGSADLGHPAARPAPADPRRLLPLQRPQHRRRRSSGPPRSALRRPGGPPVVQARSRARRASARRGPCRSAPAAACRKVAIRNGVVRATLRSSRRHPDLPVPRRASTTLTTVMVARRLTIRSPGHGECRSAARGGLGGTARRSQHGRGRWDGHRRPRTAKWDNGSAVDTLEGDVGPHVADVAGRRSFTDRAVGHRVACPALRSPHRP